MKAVLNEEYRLHKLAADGFHRGALVYLFSGVFRDEKGEISRMIRCPSWREGWLADVYARIKMQDSEEKEDASLN